MRILITGGAGFVGANVASHFLAQGHELVLFDSGARRGSQANLERLRVRHRHSSGFEFYEGDVRDADAVRRAAQSVDAVFHLAAQVAVTTSVKDPVHDFQVNAWGTLNVLEAVRAHCPDAAVFYTSTNKVYGGLEDVELRAHETRYEATGLPDGIDESRPLCFHSPYGCSKGAGDQYVQDYARIYGMKTVTFRMSCIYGPLQNGNEDQGWVAHFARRFLEEGELNIYGDGKQVRDVLHVSDLARAFELALANLETTSGKAYNIGGGSRQSISLIELIDMLERKTGYTCPLHWDDWRPGDQRWYVSNTKRAGEEFGWSPQIEPEQGIDDLLAWLRESQAASRS